MVERLLHLMNSSLQPDIRAESSHEIPHQYLSADKARRLLNWAPRYDLDDALRETIAWYRTFLERRDVAPNKHAA